MISLFLDIVAWIIAMGVAVWVMIFVFKMVLSSKKTRQHKDALKMVEKFEIGFRKTYRYIFFYIEIIVNMAISTLIGIALKPYIFLINYPLGEGYATFASYVVAISIFTLLPEWFAFPQEKEMEDLE